MFATGDAATTLADGSEYGAMIDALIIGHVSGFNAANMLEVPLVEYSQPDCIKCLDLLVVWGTVVTYGWDREVKLTRDMAQRVKVFISHKLISTPESATESPSFADPGVIPASGLLGRILQHVS
jgi:hypothetical protein